MQGPEKESVPKTPETPEAKQQPKFHVGKYVSIDNRLFKIRKINNKKKELTLRACNENECNNVREAMMKESMEGKK